LQRFVGETVKGYSLAVRVEEGDASQAILRVAQSTGSGLIIMGTHEPTGLSRLTLGSVTEQVLHKSNIPVLMIRPTDRVAGISKILCAVNDSEVSQRTLKHAAKLAKCMGARLTVIHVLEAEGRRAIPDLCAWIAQQDRPNSEIEEVTRHGHPVEQIIRSAAELDADLLVVGVEHKLFLDKTVDRANDCSAFAACTVRSTGCGGRNNRRCCTGSEPQAA
jgi:nucleotide-binding universal stress UspA family protein